MWNALLGAVLIVFSLMFLIAYIRKACKSITVSDKELALIMPIWILTMWWVLLQFNF